MPVVAGRLVLYKSPPEKNFQIWKVVEIANKNLRISKTCLRSGYQIRSTWQFLANFRAIGLGKNEKLLSTHTPILWFIFERNIQITNGKKDDVFIETVVDIRMLVILL